MELFPAIDLREGQAVRLFQGDYDQMTVYSRNPADVAKSFKEKGAKTFTWLIWTARRMENW